MKVVSGEECVSQHRLLVCDIVVKNAKEVQATSEGMEVK